MACSSNRLPELRLPPFWLLAPGTSPLPFPTALSSTLHSPLVLRQLAPRIPHIIRLLILLPPEIQTHTMVIHQTRARLAAHQQHRQQHHADNHIQLRRRLALVPPILLRTPSHPPRIQVHHENYIVHQRMTDCHLDSGYHGVLLFPSGVFLPGPTVLLDHPDELYVSCHDGRHGGDEGAAHEEVADAGHVELGGRGAEAGGQEVGFDVGGSEGVGDIDAPGEDVEGDGKMD
jgi:hypothetical protein